MARVQGRVAIVTGGAVGLGAAVVRRLRSEGALVVITDIQVDAGQRLADELKCQFISHDVTDEKQWESVVGAVTDRYGALHILVNNAGIGGPFDMSTPETTRLSDWQMVHRINVEGVFLGCRVAIPSLRESGGGSIVNIASTAGLAAAPDFVAYGASKAAVRHLTKSVAMHCARNGSKIRCNSVHPGIIMTSMMQQIIDDMARKRGVEPEVMAQEFRSAIPQGEFQTSEDIANAILFLASDEARHITGLAMIVDGGFSAGL